MAVRRVSQSELKRSLRSRIMAAVSSKGTAPERMVRSVVRKAGFRFRCNDPKLLGRPDIVFKRERAVLFVHGCYWHAHNCRWGKSPRSNVQFWATKRSRNKLRDRQVVRKLRSQGWRVLTIWSCQTRDAHLLLRRIEEFVRAKPQSTWLRQGRPITRNEV
jgi:DNA mismatch endonuclease, patch repair protein